MTGNSGRFALNSPKVSRRHAIINEPKLASILDIDLGRINGTFLNARRVHHPVCLSDFDQVTIGDASCRRSSPVR
jgi:pSer/pThr/pTyr-binding forkhead associated (FHA) protein